MRRRVVFLLLIWCFVTSSGLALIGVPCDPEKDFPDVYLLDHWKILPHKNQEESKERCDEVNARLGKAAWKYDPNPNKSVYECLSYGASTVADWWAQEMGWKLDSYKSYAHGKREFGFNPRKLELRYRHRTKSNPLHFAMVGLKAGDRCPVTGDWVPIRPSGFARLLTDRDADSLPDPVDGVRFEYKGTDYPMEGEWFSIVTKNWNKNGVEEKLIKALKDLGPLYVQYERPGQHFFIGTHAPVVIGSGKLADGKVVFICHDSYGNFPKTHPQDKDGANAYRYVLADEIDEAIVFPHRPVVRATRSGAGAIVRFTNRAGRPLKVRLARYMDGSGKDQEMDLSANASFLVPAGGVKDKTVTIYVEADYYMKENGRGHVLIVPVTNP